MTECPICKARMHLCSNTGLQLHCNHKLIPPCNFNPDDYVIVKPENVMTEEKQASMKLITNAVRPWLDVFSVDAAEREEGGE